MLFYENRLTWVWDRQMGVCSAVALRMEFLSSARLCEGRCLEVQAN